MPKDPNSALAVTEPEGEPEIDDEIDLLAETNEEICPTCGSLLIEKGEDSFLLECPICDRPSADRNWRVARSGRRHRREAVRTWD